MYGSKCILACGLLAAVWHCFPNFALGGASVEVWNYSDVIVNPAYSVDGQDWNTFGLVGGQQMDPGTYLVGSSPWGSTVRFFDGNHNFAGSWASSPSGYVPNSGYIAVIFGTVPGGGGGGVMTNGVGDLNVYGGVWPHIRTWVINATADVITPYAVWPAVSAFGCFGPVGSGSGSATNEVGPGFSFVAGSSAERWSGPYATRWFISTNWAQGYGESNLIGGTVEICHVVGSSSRPAFLGPEFRNDWTAGLSQTSVVRRTVVNRVTVTNVLQRP